MRKINYWLPKFFTVFGCIWLFLEAAALCFETFKDLGWCGYLLIIVTSSIITAFLFRPKNKASAYFADANFSISVTSSNILKQEGSVLIAASDTFDTEIGDIICKKSLIGQLIMDQYNGDSKRIDSDILTSLAGIKGREDKSKEFGKTIRYPIGSVVPIQIGKAKYFLLALNKMMSKEKKVETNLRKYGSSLDSAWDSIRSNGNHQPIHATLMSTVYGRSGMTPLFVAQLIINSYILASKTEQISPSLTIHIHSSDTAKFDFGLVQIWLDALQNQKG